MVFLQNCVLKKVSKEEDQLNVLRKKREAWGHRIPGVILQVSTRAGRLQESTGHGGGSTRNRYWEQTSGFKSSIRAQCRKSIATSNSTVISTNKSTHKAKLHNNVCLLPFLLGGDKEYIYAWIKGRGHTMQQLSLVQRVRRSLLFAL